MLRTLLLLALLIINKIAYAQIDTEFLSNELFNITEHSLKKNVYVYHLASQDFGEMTPSELALNLKNIDNLFDQPALKEHMTENDISDVKKNFSDIFQAIYIDKDPKINQAVTYNIQKNDTVFALIAIPNIYYEAYDDCAGAFILFESYTCFELDRSTRSFLTKYIARNHVPKLDSDYLGMFIVVHEYAHALPEQLKLNLSEFYAKVTNVDAKRERYLIHHYNEIYSDLYAGIRLLQKGYSKEYLDQIIFMRNVGMYLSKDTLHFSTPYLKALKNLNKEDYMVATTFKEIDAIINKIFFSVINEKNTLDEKLFFAEKMEVRDKLTDIASFAFNVNKDVKNNTFQKKTEEQADFINKLFNKFINSIYYANRRFMLAYPDKDLN